MPQKTMNKKLDQDIESIKPSPSSSFQSSQPSSPAEPSLTEETEEELALILKEHTAELKEKEARKKEEEKKLRLAEIKKRKEEGAEHEGKPKIAQTRTKLRHGKKYRQVSQKVDRAKKYKIAEALVLVKELSLTKFDASVDAHIHVSDQNVRGIINLPHGTGKKIKVAIVSDELIEEIKKGKIDFDTLVSSPKFMPQLAKVAKILGPKGLMPTPKSGTISDDPEKTKKELETGKMEFRADKDFVVHTSIGRVSWPAEKLEDNLKVLVQALVSAKIKSVYIAPTMGPSLKLEVE